MDLDSIIDSVVPPHSRGRRAVEVQTTVRRQLNPADIEQLWLQPEGALGSTTPPIQKIRFQHHSLARLLAEGRPDAECALITGYSPSRISILKRDPAVMELISHYKEMVTEVFVNVHERLAALGLNTIEELMERLDTDPDSFSVRELKEVAELTLDRSGYGPQSKVHHTGAIAVLDASHVARIKQEVASRQNGTVRSLNPSTSGWPQVGGPVIDGSVGKAEETQGSESQGDNLPERGGAGTGTEVP